MASWLARRVLLAVVLVMSASSAALILTRLAPGDITGQLGAFARPAEVAALRARFDLDRPAPVQWALWVGRAARFDFGTSFLYNRPVGEMVGKAAVNTAILATAALIVSTAAGLPLGVLTGYGTGALPVIVRATSLLLVSLPPLLMSLLLVFVAARTGWFPAGGMSSGSVVDLGWGGWLADVARHLPLPTLALALPLAATFERLQSQAIAEVVHQPFLAAAAARGVSAERALWRHAWPVSLRPICAVYGMSIGALLSGSFVVEYITAWPGLGRLMYEALRARDIYLVAGCAATGAVFLAIGMLIGDVLLAALDPRVRERREA
jgi:peptide/nickel transport system permease protein